MMPSSSDPKEGVVLTDTKKHGGKLGTVSGVYIPVCLNILSILMFLRFGVILGRVGFLGIVGLLLVAYCIDFLTLFSLSAIASNGEVKGGGAYYLISRSLGPEFGGSIGILFYIASVLNSAMNVVGFIDCIRLNVGPGFPQGYWVGYGLQTAALFLCAGLCLLSSSKFSFASNGLLGILSLAVISIPASALFKPPFHDEELGIHFTGVSLDTLADNFLPHTNSSSFSGAATFRDLFGILFPATAGILAGASMSGDLRDPSKSIPKGTLWATLTTFIVYFVVVLSLAASTTHASFLANPNVIPLTNLAQPIIFAGECSVTAFSALIGIKTSTGLFRALSRDKLLPGMFVFSKGVGRRDDPIAALLVTYAIAQLAMLCDLNQIATFISMGFQMTFFVMNMACFFLKIGSAPNFRPAFKFFNWQTAFLGSLMSGAAMFFIDETYAALAICVVVSLFLLIHYLCPPKRWGDVSQNLIYHQVRKYLLRLRPEHIKFWRPHIILLINDPRKQTRLIQFCNSMKKGSLYILGHVIVTDDFSVGVHEARLQQQAWTKYISESSRIKAFMQLTMSPSITWGVRNLILSAGLGGMRPNVAVLGFYNMDELRRSNPRFPVPDIPTSPAMKMRRAPPKSEGKRPSRHRGDTSARLLAGFLPTDVIRTEGMMKPTEYMTILEDLTLRHRMNVAVGYGFDKLETPRKDKENTKKYIDLWPIQMSAEVTSDGKNVLTTNFDTYTLILQLGHILHSVKTWRRAYELRIMVFVEYENEVQQESARVRALLDKLRIDAKVIVFWLASGQLNTYELIVNGQSHDMDWEIIVNEALRDEEWWDDLQVFRGEYDQMSSSQERSQLAHILDSTSGRPGVYNPHGEFGADRRRADLADLSEVPKRPGISVLTRLGVNVGMHTSHLHRDVLQEANCEIGDSNEASSSSDEDEEDETDDESGSEMRDTVAESSDPSRRPLLSDIHRHVAQTLGEQMDQRQSVSKGHRRSSKLAQSIETSTAPQYGTMSTSQTLMENEESLSNAPREKAGSEVRKDGEPREKEEPFPVLDLKETYEDASMSSRRPRSVSPTRAAQQAIAGSVSLARPVISRQSSGVRFSSRPVPETTVTTEGDGTRISFADSGPSTPRIERPQASRQSSYGHGRFSSRPRPEAKLIEGEEGTRTISFADQPTFHSPSRPHSPLVSHHSRQTSRNHSRQSSYSGQGDLILSIPALLNSYRLPAAGEEPETGSTYSTQSFSLSFNDLPSRAQHLILNELMRQNSSDTAVLMTTLPIPSEGTSLDEMETIRYLSDVEVLCNELPPMLMVLSNSMTVTVSL